MSLRCFHIAIDRIVLRLKGWQHRAQQMVTPVEISALEIFTPADRILLSEFDAAMFTLERSGNQAEVKLRRAAKEVANRLRLLQRYAESMDACGEECRLFHGRELFDAMDERALFAFEAARAEVTKSTPLFDLRECQC